MPRLQLPIFPADTISEIKARMRIRGVTSLLKPVFRLSWLVRSMGFVSGWCSVLFFFFVLTQATAATISGTLTPASPSCSIAAGASTCTVSLTWSTTNPVGTSAVMSSYPVANTTVATGNSGSTTASVPHNGRTFYLYNSAQLLATSTATASCASGTTWNGSVCQAPTPQPTGSLTLSPSSCTITAGNSSCNISLSWTTTNPVGTSAVTSNTPAANTPIGSGNNSSATASVPPSGRSFFLINNQIQLDTKSATASCASGTTWNGSVCQAPTPQPTGSLTLSPSSCTITAGNSTCDINLSWTTTNPVGTSAVTSNTPAANTPIGGGNNSSATASVPPSGRSFFLINNQIQLDTKSATASCASGTTWNGSLCQSNAVNPTGTLTLASSSCTITAGNNRCNVNATWSTTNPGPGSTSAITADGQTLATGNSGGPTPLPVPYGSRTFYLYNSGALLDQKTATASCASGTTWNGSACQAPTTGTGQITVVPNPCTIASQGGNCAVILSRSE